jgi:molecular chaperone DnaK
MAIDKAEELLEWPTLVKKAEEVIEYTRKDVYGKYGNAVDKEKFIGYENEIRHAIQAKDAELLRQKINFMDSLDFTVYERNPGVWVGFLDYCKEHKNEMSNISEAEQLISRGDRAINNNDIESLKSSVSALLRLLPPSKQQGIIGHRSTII